MRHVRNTIIDNISMAPLTGSIAGGCAPSIASIAESADTYVAGAATSAQG